jgi:hypothetical protein
MFIKNEYGLIQIDAVFIQKNNNNKKEEFSSSLQVVFSIVDRSQFEI